MTPEDFDALAKSLHHEWETPGLWTRISRRRHWPRLVVLASIAAALLVAFYLVPSGTRGATPVGGDDSLLTEQAMADVAAAETAYRRSIDRLARVAAPRLERPATPLLRAYAEKLELLDAAIASLRTEMERNEFNAHLHVRMAAVYRDKQKTLEEVLRHE